jgi:hypothetical protein
LKQWESRLTRGENRSKLFHPQWERGLSNYAKAIVPKKSRQLNALLDYRHVESKKAQLFHRTPEVTLTPIDPADQQIPYHMLLPLRQKFLNYELGPCGANAKRALHKTLIDTLAASGWMICVVGFEAVSLPDPLTGMPTVMLGERFITAISSKKLIVPDDFTDSSNFDAAPWLAYTGVMPATQARRAGWAIPKDFTGTAQKDEHVYEHGEVTGDATDAQVEYTVIWYKAAQFDPAVWHPKLYRCLVLVKGLEQAAWHVDSPFQELDPQGQLTDQSLVGNPIHVGTLRDLTDSAYVPSDLCVGEQLSSELNKFRTDLTENRKARRPLTFLSDAVGAEKAEKLWKDHGGIVPQEFIGDGGTQRIAAIVQAGSEPRDNYTAQQIIEHDFQEALGQGANQRGQVNPRKTTATEARIVQGNSDARAETERDRMREYFIGLVRKFDTIVQRTVTPQELQKVLGQQGAQLWEQWRVLPGKYAYEIVPDSGQYVDAEEYRASVINNYNLLRKDDRVNTDDLLTMVARALNRDPGKFINPPQPPKAEQPNMTINFKGEDTANAAMWNLLIDVLVACAIKVSPQTQQAAELQHGVVKAAQQAGLLPPGPPSAANNSHGGAADRTEPINQHSTERTGRVQGSVQ